ncbi:dehydratase [Halobacteriales archaeon QS_4_66_20]|nr:MAG: dehydratase [Halobacteriales archaeon QS_4_66_20]
MSADERTTDDVSADERTTGEGPTDGEPSDGTPDDGDRLYVEDLSVGQTWDAGRVTFTEEGIVAFAEEFDPQPFHVDPEAAGNHFDDVIASGWHTAAACMRPFVTAVLANVAVVAAVGIDDLRWHKPVSPGDTLSVTASVVDTDSWSDRRGKVTFGIEATDPTGERVHSRKDLVLVERRTPDARSEPGEQ